MTLYCVSVKCMFIGGAECREFETEAPILQLRKQWR